MRRPGRAAALVCAVLSCLAPFGVSQVPQCDGAEEAGIRWDVVRADLSHILQHVREGALSRDLHASKDSGGRDPAVSYGDVQLQRHLERFQQLADFLPRRVQCEVGRHSVLLFVSALYSGLPWRAWYARYDTELSTVVHRVDWSKAVGSGWPLLQVLGLGGDFHALEELPKGCDAADLEAAIAPASGKGAAADPGSGKPWCPFLRAVNAVAAAIAAAEAPGGDAAAPERLASMAAAQAAVQRAVGYGGNRTYPALFTAPLPVLFSRLGDAWHRRASERNQASRLDIVYCGHLDIEDELQRLCGGVPCTLHTRYYETKAESRRACYAHYRGSIEAIRVHSRPGHPQMKIPQRVLLVSPLVWQWGDGMRDDLRNLLREQARWRDEAGVVLAGLSCLNRSRIFNWPVRRLRQQYWKLAYDEYATGHETSPYMPLAQWWAVGDTTSATRVYDAAVLLELEAMLAKHEVEYPAALPGGDGDEQLPLPLDVSELFVALDLLAKEAGYQAYTLLRGSTQEDDYKSHASLSEHLARTFHIEWARFLPRSASQIHCLFPSSKTAAAFTSRHGVVVNWCTRRGLRDMFRTLGSWWLSLAPRSHIIVPVSASVLNIYRSGETELFPWDADIDANFIADHPIVVGSFLEEHREALRMMGYAYILRGDRAVIHDMADTVRMDLWLSGPQDVRAYDIRARFCGVRVNFFRDQLEGTVWYYRPGEKIYGNTRGKLLHCTWRGHNACLPDCLRSGLGVGSDGCEFADRFVHPDV